MDSTKNIIDAICTYVMNHADYSTRKSLNGDVVLQSNGEYAPKDVSVTKTGKLTYANKTLFAKWLTTNLCLLAHNKHALAQDDVLSIKYDPKAYQCIKPVVDLAVATVVTMVPDVTRLSKPIYAYDFTPDNDMVMSSFEFNAFQQRLALQAKDTDKSPFSSELKPLTFTTAALTDLSVIYVDGALKAVNTKTDTSFPVVVLHVQFDTDPSYFDDAREVSVEEAILSYGG